MKYNKFEKIGIDISRFGLGCMRFPTIELPDGSKNIDQDKVNEIG